VTDLHSQLRTFPDGMPAAARPPVRLGMFLGHAVEWLSHQCTAWGLGGFGAIVGGLVLFSPLIDGGTTQLPVLIIRLVLLVSAVIWMLGRMKACELFLPQTRLLACVALFAGWAILSLVWSPYKNASVQWVLSILSYTALFSMVTHGVRSQVQIQTLLFVVTGIGMVEGLWGMTQYLWLGETRTHGTFFNPNFFAAYQAAVLLLSLGLLLFPRYDALPQFNKRWLWCTAAVSLTAFVMAQSRGATLALLGALSFLAFCRYGKKAFAILAVCLLAGLLVPNPLQHRIAHVAEDPYAYSRLDIWKSSVVRLLEHPLGIGVGMYKQGSFQDRFPIEGDIVRYRKRPESAHNEYLQMGVELGVVGLFLFLCGAGLLAAEIRHLLRQPTDGMDQGLVMGLTTAALVLLLHAAVDSSFHEPALVILLLLMGGLIHNLYLRSRPESVIWRRIGFSYHPVRAVYVLAGAAIIAAICAQSTAAWYAHDEGKHHAAQDDLEGALAWYAYAADIDPGTTGYHDSIARTAMQLYSESGKSEWLVTAAEEEAVARKLNPLDGRFAFRLGTIYRLMAVQSLTSAQRAELLSKASEAFSEAIQLDPYSPFSYFELAQIRLAEGRVEETLTLLTIATTHEPNFLPGRALLAELSLQTGIPGDYVREMANITAIRSRYAQQVRDDVERQFMKVDLYPLGRAIALRAKP